MSASLFIGWQGAGLYITRRMDMPMHAFVHNHVPMSKAFTKESDSGDEDDELGGLPPLPAGTRNYMTPQGYQRLRDELLHRRHRVAVAGA